MKTSKFLVVMILSLAIFTTMACTVSSGVPNIKIGFGRNYIEGSGDVITETREVSGFDRISLSGFGKVNVVQGDEESLTVTTDDNIMPYIETEVRGDTLVLGFTDDGEHKSFDPTKGITFDLVVKDLSRIDVSGAGDIQVDALETESLRVELSGAGNLYIDSIVADELVIRISGAGNASVGGVVTGQDITLSGAGNYNGGDLESETAIIEMSGVGNGTVWATENLDIHMSGVGNLEYYGSPRVIQNVSGFGVVRSLGEK
jgi:hypothetical protein